MNIITLVKQVPDTAQLSGNFDGLQLMRDKNAKIVNPWDEYALETGIRLKEVYGGKVTILSLGGPETEDAQRHGLAMGADEAILISDLALEGSDSLATARALTAAIKKIGDYDIIIAGRSAIDGNTAATAVQVATLLRIPQLSYVAQIKAIDSAAKTIIVDRLLESGRETVSSKLPAVISVVKEINEPRHTYFLGIRRAAKVNIPTWGIAELGLQASQVGVAGSQVKWPEVNLATAREASIEFIEGEPAEAAEALISKLIAEKVL